MEDERIKELEQYQAIVKLCKEMVGNSRKGMKALFIALVISLCVNVAIVGAFLVYESHIETTDTITTTYQQDTDGDNSDIVNGNQYNDSAVHNDGGQ